MKKRNIILTVVLTTLLLPSVFALQITSEPLTAGEVNELYTYNVETDQDNITFSLLENPNGMNIDEETGNITWTPNEPGNIDVTVQAQNGTTEENNTATANQSYTIQVQDVAPGRFEASNLNLGEGNQERDEVATTEYDIQNTGKKEITNIDLSFQNVPSRYRVSIVSPITTLQPGETRTVTVEYFIPEDQDSGTENIGSIRLNGQTDGEDVSLTRTVTVEPEQGLEIQEVDVEVDGRSDSVDNGDTVDREAELGDEIIVTIELENRLDVDMEDVEIELTSRDVDTADGLEEEIDIDAGDEEDVEFRFILEPEELDIRSSDLRFEIDIDGEDENDARHQQTFSFDIELELEDEEVTIIDNTLQDTTLRCGQQVLTLNTEISNVGEDDLRRAMVEFRSDSLGFSEFERQIRIDTGDRERVETRIQLSEFPSQGVYDVEILAYPTDNTRTVTDSTFASITVPDCQEEEEQEDSSNEEQEENVEPTRPQPIQVTGTPVVTNTGTSTNDEEDETLYVLAGIVAVLIVTTGWVLGKVLS